MADFTLDSSILQNNRNRAAPLFPKDFKLPDPGPLLHGQMEINGIRFPIDPQGISVVEENFNHKFETLRTRESAKVRSGHSRINISVRAIFTGLTVGDKNGNSTSSSLGTINSTLMPILYSLKKMPLCFIDNELIRRSLPIVSYETVTEVEGKSHKILAGENIGAFVKSVNIGTVPGLPEALSAEFEFVWYNHRPFTPRLRFRKEWVDKSVISFLREEYGQGRDPFTDEFHQNRQVFLDTYGHPSIAANATAVSTWTDSIHQSRPLLEYLWPYLYESSNPMQTEKRQVEDIKNLPPFELQSFDKNIGFEFDVLRTPPADLLNAILEITGANEAEKLRRQRESLGLPETEERVGPLTREDVQRWAREKDVHEDILLASIILNSEQGRGSQAERDAIIHSLFNNSIRKGQSAWDYAVGPGNVTGEQGGRRRYSSARMPSESELEASLKQVIEILKARSKDGTSMDGVTNFIHPFSMRPRDFRARDKEGNFLVRVADIPEEKRLEAADNVTIEWVTNGAKQIPVAGVNPQTVRFFSYGTVGSFRVKEHAKELLTSRLERTKVKSSEVFEISPQEALAIVGESFGIDNLAEEGLIKAIRKEVQENGNISSSDRRRYAELVELAEKGWTLKVNRVTGKPVLMNNLTLEIQDESSTVIPISLHVGFGTNLVMTPLQGHRFPTVQYIGGQHTGVSLSIRCEGEGGRKFISQLKSLINSSEESAIHFREFTDKRGVKIKNPLLNALNIKEVMIEGLSVDTVKGQPEGLVLNIALIDSTINSAMNPLLAGRREADLDNLTYRVIDLIIKKGWIEFQTKKEKTAESPYNRTARGRILFEAPEGLLDEDNKEDSFTVLATPGANIPVQAQSLLQRVIDEMAPQEVFLVDPNGARQTYTGKEYQELTKTSVPYFLHQLELSEAIWSFLFGSSLSKGRLSAGTSSQKTIKVLLVKLIAIMSKEGNTSFPPDEDFVALQTQIRGDISIDITHEAYPDLMLPPNQITGLVQDTTPDFFLYNESDVKLCNSNLLRLIHGEASTDFAKEKGFQKGLQAIADAAQGVRHAYGVDPPVEGGIQPAHIGRLTESGRGVYEDFNNGQFKTLHNKGTVSRYDVSETQDSTGPDLQGALISGARGKLGNPGVDKALTNISSRTTSITEETREYSKEQALNFHFQNSPAKDFFTEDPVNMNKLMHVFSEDEYKKIFDDFQTHYSSEHYAVRRSFPTFKVFFVDELGAEGRNEQSQLAANLTTSYALDDFYGVNAIKEIRVVHNKYMAASVCIIELLDLDGVLYNRKYLEEGSEFGLRNTVKKERKNPFLDTVIKEGMKIVVKFGYSNDPKELETVFVGQIVAWEGSSVIEIIAQSYGSELVSHKFGTDPSENADLWNVTTADLLHDLLDREEVRHFGRWKLEDIDLFGSIFGHEKLRPDGKTKRVWTWKPSVVDDNLFIPDVETYSSGWARFWGDLEYVFFNTTIWDVFKEMELRHPGYIAYPVPYGDSTDARMTMFFGHPSMEYLYRPAETEDERQAELMQNDPLAVREALIKIGKRLSPGGDQKRYVAGLKFTQEVQPESLQRLAEVAGVNNIENLFIDAQYAQEQLKYLNELKDIHSSDFDSIPEAKFWKATMVAQKGRVKSFRNYELITSLHDIIDNNIRADHRDTFNSIELRYSDEDVDFADFDQDSGVNSIVVNADDNIKEHHIRRAIEGWPNCTTSDLARRYASQLLANSLKQTYKGDIIILGRPQLKPYDIVWVYDNYSDMAGPIEVEEVVHSFSSHTGFTTEIVPNMIVTVKEEVTTLMVDAIGAFFTEHLKEFTNGALIGFSGVGAAGLGVRLITGANATTAGAVTGSLLAGPSASLPGAALLLEEERQANQQEASQTSLGLITGATAGALLHTVPIIPCSAGLVAGALLYKFLKYNSTREPIIITPLIKQGKPFVTGIEGMESDGLIVADLFSQDEERRRRATKNIITRKWKHFIDGFEDANTVLEQGLVNWLSR